MVASVAGTLFSYQIQQAQNIANSATKTMGGNPFVFLGAFDSTKLIRAFFLLLLKRRFVVAYLILNGISYKAWHRFPNLN